MMQSLPGVFVLASTEGQMLRFLLFWYFLTLPAIILTEVLQEFVFRSGVAAKM